MKLPLIFRSTLLIALVAGLSFATPIPNVYAATLTVNTLVDENDGSCLDGDCSLRDAIDVANSGDTITFNGSGTGTILLTDDLEITQNLIITGPGSGQLTLDGNNAFRIFTIYGSVTVSISGMTMTNGNPDPSDTSNSRCGGGAIYNTAFLTLDDVVLADNTTYEDNAWCAYPRGGGITVWDFGSLTITDSTISNNEAYSHGGGIFFGSANGALSLTNVVIEGNESLNYEGAGLYYDTGNATATLNNVTISDNSSPVGGGTRGGGVVTNDSMNITNSLINSNSAQNGAGIYSDQATLNITNTTISNNSAGEDGGGLYSSNSTININSSTFNGNSSGITTYSEGGAIFNLGNGATSTVNISNSTITGNDAYYGGAIYNQASGGDPTDVAYTNVTNSTIVGNQAKTDYGGGGLVASDAGGNEVSTITLSNSIVYGNTLTTGTGGENCNNVNDAMIVKNNHNLFQTLAIDACTAEGTDITSSNAVSTIVNPLANNGTSTQIMSLPVGSPAVNAGDGGICAAPPVNNASQNGLIRPQGAHCDIGSVEADFISPTVSTSVRVDPDPTSLATVRFTVTFSEAVTGVDAGDMGLTTTGAINSAAITNVSGSGATYTVTVHTGVGSGTIRLNIFNNLSIEDLYGNALSGGDFISGQSYTVNKSAIFADVPYSYWANVSIERLYGAGITGGCSASPLNYCPESLVTRDQMAVFLERGIHGSSFSPPNVVPTFNDTAGNFAEDWIEALKNDGITGGCGTNIYCPSQGVTRAQMAIFLERAMHGASFTPPNVSPTFSDTAGHFAEDWIEALKNDSITSGCGSDTYCPDAIVTRAQMAVFLVKAFGLP